MRHRRHYYGFTFRHGYGGKEITASVYIGYKHKFISIPQIEDAKASAEVDGGAVLLSCYYLGKMTMKEFRTGFKEGIIERLKGD